MSRTSICALTFLALLAAPALACAQAAQSTPPCPKTDKSSDGSQGKAKPASPPCTPPNAAEPPAAQRFPFPGESTQSEPKPQKQSPSATPNAAPDAPAPNGKEPSAADKFPFPTSSAPPMPGAENSGSSSSSSSSSSDSSSSSSNDPADTPSSAKPPLDDKGDNPRAAVRRRLPKVEKLQSDEERAEEDLKISKFYADAGNFNAAYLRARDAVKSLPDDPDTHFALAQVAQKMKKREEAIAEYNNYLQMAPDGLKIKDAHKALTDLQH